MPRTAPRPFIWSSNEDDRISQADVQLNWSIVAAVAFCGAVWAGALLLASAIV
ncbi:hypothetical protein ABOZ73_00925 [Caulobacter sp. 73W]|uniref:Uncharacterized protein n=1 Tax=Caulobacter sp. 73W TaxID=3161137 RepID=A0AB39KT85_9CAUL